MNKAQNNVTLNPEMLALARQARGYTQSRFAQKLKVTQGRISKIEMGTLQCPQNLIVKFAELLNFPVTFFTRQRRVYGLPLSVHGLFRKKQSLGKKEIEKILATININRLAVEDLLQSVELTADDRIPSVAPEDHDGDISHIAKIVRRLWLLPSGPVKDLSDIIESHGGIIIECDFGTDKIDGLSQRIIGFPPIIFIRRGMSGDRQRFTIAHELGHLVLHDKSPSPNMEDEANEFASEFLMPREDIKSSLRGLTLQKLAILKGQWKVSMQALLYRAKTLGVISENKSRYLWMQLSKAGYRKNEPVRVEAEVPSILKQLIDVHLTEFGYTEKELAKALRLSFLDYKQLCCIGNRPDLRIV
jgi:Zn-dependent peptidase ImmA (M78 family)/transcriptional regulator with XRE-family HTH domain